jgi:uncharacterized damage-inducible protein DinB
MPARQPLDVARELVEAFEQCGRATEYLIERVPAAIWQGAPPSGSGRTIAAMVAHIHSVRKMIAKMGGAPATPPLDRTRVTPQQAIRAVAAVNAALTQMFRESLARGEARVKGMPRRSVNQMTYLMLHDAHHRGQIMLRARELGHAFSSEDVMRLWGWKKMP